MNNKKIQKTIIWLQTVSKVGIIANTTAKLYSLLKIIIRLLQTVILILVIKLDLYRLLRQNLPWWIVWHSLKIYKNSASIDKNKAMLNYFKLKTLTKNRN